MEPITTTLTAVDRVCYFFFFRSAFELLLIASASLVRQQLLSFIIGFVGYLAAYVRVLSLPLSHTLSLYLPPSLSHSLYLSLSLSLSFTLSLSHSLSLFLSLTFSLSHSLSPSLAIASTHDSGILV